MDIDENLSDLWWSASPERRTLIRQCWRDLARALDELTPPGGDAGDNLDEYAESLVPDVTG